MPKVDGNPPATARPLETHNDLLSKVADFVPTFGGAWVEGDDLVGEQETLHLWLTDVTGNDVAQRVRHHLVAILGERFQQDSVEIHHAEYSWVRLEEWFRTISDDGMPEVDLGYIGIREQENRVVIGVVEPQVEAPAIEKALARLNVPRGAVTIESGGPMVLDLRQKRRPLIGGTQLEFETGGGLLSQETSLCTLGFPSHFGDLSGGHDGFVTAAHCSKEWGDVDNTHYWQPERPVLSRQVVGNEVIDPSFSSFTGCPASKRCRYSDANFVWVDSSDPPVNIARGQIASPGRHGNGPTEWDGVTKWRVVGTQLSQLDTFAYKVGWRTGETRGRIVDTCFNQFIRNSDIVLLCQVVAQMGDRLRGGDSGSPVFRITHYPELFDVQALGILSGHVVGNPNQMVFSDILRVEGEVAGNREDLHVCHPEFFC